MSDTVAVALITASSGALGACVAYLASRQQARTAIATAKTEADSKAREIRAENERLREQVRDEERRNRHEAYQQCLLVLNHFEEIESATNLADEQIEKAWERYRSMRTKLELHADGAVVEKLVGEKRSGGLNIVLAEIRRYSWGAGPKGRAERWQEQFHKRRIKFQGAQRRLIEAMRADITSGVFVAKGGR